MTQEILYEISFDALEAAIIAHREWFSMFMWLHVERVELSQAYVSYKLAHDYLGKIGEIRIRKRNSTISQIELDDSPGATKDQIYNDLIRFLNDSDSSYFRGMDNPRLLRLQELVKRFELATENIVLGMARPSLGKWWTRRKDYWLIINKEMEGKKASHEFFIALDKEMREREKEVKELSETVIRIFMAHLEEDLALTSEIEKEKTVTQLNTTSLSPPDANTQPQLADDEEKLIKLYSDHSLRVVDAALRFPMGASTFKKKAGKLIEEGRLKPRRPKQSAAMKARKARKGQES